MSVRPPSRLYLVLSGEAGALTWFSWFSVYLAYALVCVPPHGDVLGIISTGRHILEFGSYGEYGYSYSHRGVIPSVLFGGLPFVVQNFRWALALGAGICGAATIVGLIRLSKPYLHEHVRLVGPVFCVFPFLAYTFNTSAVHIVQGTFYVLVLVWIVKAGRTPEP